MKNKTCIVTGAMGFIGCNLTRALLKEGYKVIGIDNLSTGKYENVRHLEQQKFKYYIGDINQSLTNIFQDNKPEAIIHLAAMPRVQLSFDKPKETTYTNVDGTVNLLEYARKYGVKRFVFASSSSVYGGAKTFPTTEEEPTLPTSPYALHKLFGEHTLRIYHNAYGLETIALRFHNVIGPFQDETGGYANLVPKHIYCALDGVDLPVYGDGTIVRDFTSVNDVARACILALETQNPEAYGQAFNIGNGNPRSVNDVSNEIIKQTNSKSKIVYLPPRIEPAKTHCSYEKAKKMLGWEPKQSFEDIIAEEIEFFKNKRR